VWEFYQEECPERPPNEEAICCMSEGGTYTLANDDKGAYGICATDHGLIEGQYFKSTYCPSSGSSDESSSDSESSSLSESEDEELRIQSSHETRYQVYANNNCVEGPTTAKANFDLNWDFLDDYLSIGQCKFVGNTVHGESTAIGAQIGMYLNQEDFHFSCKVISETNDNEHCHIVNDDKIEEGDVACVIDLCS